MKKVTGGAPQRRFFQASWKLVLLKEEVKTTQEIANEASQLKDDKAHLKEKLKERETELVEHATKNEELQRELSQLKEQSQAVKELEKAKIEKAGIQRKASVLSGWMAHVTTSNLLDKRGHSRTKSVGEYSYSHLRRLKRKRRESCELSLGLIGKVTLPRKLN